MARDAVLPAFSKLQSDDVVTVDQLNAEIASVIESAAMPHHDYVVGDVTDCGVANGNVHFDLVAEEASIHCVLFGFRRDSVGTEPDEDARVAVQGDLSYYEAQGSCSILVTDAVAVGESEYQQEYEAAREAIAEDGLLDEEHRQPLPDLPSTVGLVTSADSDAASDTTTAIHSRYPDVDIVLRHASVQGDSALEELLEAISTLDRDAETDVLVVTRGGGADKTLRVFNEPALCRAIANTETPICVGVGHEDDRTIAGEVADRRVMTPTHAGGIVPEKREYIDQCDSLKDALDSTYERAVGVRLDNLGRSLVDTHESRVESELTALSDQLDHTVETLAVAQITELDRRLVAAHESVEQAKTLEAEKEAAVAEIEQDVTARMERQRRRYKIAIVVLGLLVLVLGIYAFIQFI